MKFSSVHRRLSTLTRNENHPAGPQLSRRALLVDNKQGPASAHPPHITAPGRPGLSMEGDSSTSFISGPVCGVSAPREFEPLATIDTHIQFAGNVHRPSPRPAGTPSPWPTIPDALLLRERPLRRRYQSRWRASSEAMVHYYSLLVFLGRKLLLHVW